MKHSRHLVSKEPELAPKIEKLKKQVFEKEKALFSLVDDFVTLNFRIQDFYKKVYVPRLGKYMLRIEKLKSRILGTDCGEGTEGGESENTRPKETDPDLKREIKLLYRKLVKLYHPDRAGGDKEFLTKRMEEINEAFSKNDIKSLKRYLKRAEAEIGLGLSSIERIKYLETDLSVIRDMIALYSKKTDLLKKNQMYKLMVKNPGERESVFREIENRMKFEISLNEKIVKSMEDEKKCS